METIHIGEFEVSFDEARYEDLYRKILGGKGKVPSVFFLQTPSDATASAVRRHARLSGSLPIISENDDLLGEFIRTKTLDYIQIYLERHAKRIGWSNLYELKLEIIKTIVHEMSHGLLLEGYGGIRAPIHNRITQFFDWMADKLIPVWGSIGVILLLAGSVIARSMRTAFDSAVVLLTTLLFATFASIVLIFGMLALLHGFRETVLQMIAQKILNNYGDKLWDAIEITRKEDNKNRTG